MLGDCASRMHTSHDTHLNAGHSSVLSLQSALLPPQGERSWSQDIPREGRMELHCLNQQCLFCIIVSHLFLQTNNFYSFKDIN